MQLFINNEFKGDLLENWSTGYENMLGDDVILNMADLILEIETFLTVYFQDQNKKFNISLIHEGEEGDFLIFKRGPTIQGIRSGVSCNNSRLFPYNRVNFKRGIDRIDFNLL